MLSPVLCILALQAAASTAWDSSFVPRRLLSQECNSSSLIPPEPAVTFVTQPWYSLASSPTLAANQHQVCMVHQNNSVICADHARTYILMDRAPKLLSLESQHACLVFVNDSIHCIQQAPPALQRNTPPSPSSQIQRLVSGHSHSCVLYASGVVSCWGSNQQQQLVVPASSQGQYVNIAAGMFHTCAITAAYFTVCWGGSNNWGERSVPPALQGISASVAAGGYHTCIISTQSLLQCFGWNGFGQQLVPAAYQRRVEQVAAGWAHTCVTALTGAVGCFGWNADAQSTVPDGVNYGMVLALGRTFSCCMQTSQEATYATLPTCWGSITLTGRTSIQDLPFNVSVNVSAPQPSSCQVRNVSGIAAQSCNQLPESWSCNLPKRTNTFKQGSRNVGRLPAGSVCALECGESIPQGPPVLICDISGQWTPALQGNVSSITPLVSVADLASTKGGSFAVDCTVTTEMQQQVSLWAAQQRAEGLCATPRQLVFTDLRLQACGNSWTFSYAVSANQNYLASDIVPWSSHATATRQAAAISRLLKGASKQISLYGVLFVGQTDAKNISATAALQWLGVALSELSELDEGLATLHPAFASSLGQHELRTVLSTRQSISLDVNVSTWISQLGTLIASIQVPVTTARLGLIVKSNPLCDDIGWEGLSITACASSVRASTDVDLDMAPFIREKAPSGEIKVGIVAAAPCTHAALTLYTVSIYSGMRKVDASAGNPSIVVVSTFPGAQLWIIGWVNSYHGLTCSMQGGVPVTLAGPKVHNASAVYFEISGSSTAEALEHYPCSCSLIQTISGVSLYFGADIISMSVTQPSFVSVSIGGRRLDATSVSKPFELNVRRAVQLTFTVSGNFPPAEDLLSLYSITLGGVDMTSNCIARVPSGLAVSVECTSPAVSAVCNASKTGDCGIMVLRLSPVRANAVGKSEMMLLEGAVADSVTLEMAIKSGSKRILPSLLCPPACPGLDVTAFTVATYASGPNALSFSDELLPVMYVVPPSLRPRVGAGIRYLFPCSAANFDAPALGGCTGPSCAYGAGDNCVQCPNGAICGAGYSLLSQPGYWNPSGVGSTIVQCKAPSSSRCIGAATDGRPLCGQGYSSSSSGCTACDTGYHPDEQSNECVPCEDDVISLAKPWMLLIISVAALCALGGLLGKLTQNCRSNSQKGHALGTLLYVGSAWASLGANSILARLPVPQLPAAIARLYSALSVFTFGNLDPSCASSSPFASTQAVLVVGLILLVLCLVCGGLVWGRGSRGRETVLELWYDELPGILGCVITLFAGAAAVTVFSTFNCEDAFVDVRTYLTMKSDGSSLGSLSPNAAVLYGCAADFGETTACQSVQDAMDTVLKIRVHARFGDSVCMESQHWGAVQTAVAALVVVFVMIPLAALIVNVFILRRYTGLRVARLATLNSQHQRSQGRARAHVKPDTIPPALGMRHVSLSCIFPPAMRVQMAHILAEGTGERLPMSAAKLTAFVDSLQGPFPTFSRAVMGVSYRLSAFPNWSAHIAWLGLIGVLHAWGEPASVGEAVGQLLYVVVLTTAAGLGVHYDHPISMTSPFTHSVHILSCAALIMQAVFYCVAGTVGLSRHSEAYQTASARSKIASEALQYLVILFFSIWFTWAAVVLLLNAMSPTKVYKLLTGCKIAHAVGLVPVMSDKTVVHEASSANRPTLLLNPLITARPPRVLAVPPHSSGPIGTFERSNSFRNPIANRAPIRVAKTEHVPVGVKATTPTKFPKASALGGRPSHEHHDVGHVQTKLPFQVNSPLSVHVVDGRGAFGPQKTRHTIKPRLARKGSENKSPGKIAVSIRNILSPSRPTIETSPASTALEGSLSRVNPLSSRRIVQAVPSPPVSTLTSARSLDAESRFDQYASQSSRILRQAVSKVASMQPPNESLPVPKSDPKADIHHHPLPADMPEVNSKTSQVPGVHNATAASLTSIVSRTILDNRFAKPVTPSSQHDKSEGQESSTHVPAAAKGNKRVALKGETSQAALAEGHPSLNAVAAPKVGSARIHVSTRRAAMAVKWEEESVPVIAPVMSAANPLAAYRSSKAPTLVRNTRRGKSAALK